MAELVVAETLSVTEGAVSRLVTGAFGATYVPRVVPGWVSALGVSGKSATEFLVSFAVPAPAAATLDYAVFSL